MAETIDVRDLLSQPMAKFPDMPNLPALKHFHGKLIDISSGVSREKGTPFFRFDVRLTDPEKDVPDEFLKMLAETGFSLADFNVGAEFYLLPNTMRMLRRFLTTLGFPENASFRENLKLDEIGNPTDATRDAIRGLDVLCQMPPADDQGRVLAYRINFGGMIVGTASAASAAVKK